MDQADDHAIGVDVRLPQAVVTAFRGLGRELGLRTSGLAEHLVGEWLVNPERTWVPRQSSQDRRLSPKLSSATHAQLAKVADEWKVPVGGLLRLVIEQRLQAHGKL